MTMLLLLVVVKEYVDCFFLFLLTIVLARSNAFIATIVTCLSHGTKCSVFWLS